MTLVSQWSEQRLQLLTEKLKQLALTDLRLDRDQVLAKVGELRALTKELEEYAVAIPRSGKRLNVVKMPRLGTELGGDSEFTAQVAIPPGGLTFIASAAVMQESDDEAPASVDIAEIAEAMDEMRVGGLVCPSAAKGASSSVSADLAPAEGAIVPPPSGFSVYGVESWAAPVSAPVGEGGGPAASAMAGMYGAMPLPYPLPHPLPMHCGFIPPLMYGVPASMGSPAPPPGLGASADVLAERPSELWVPEASMVDGSGRSKVVLGMAGTDHYQHAVAAAAAAAQAGFPMNVPFMYPHVDSSNISAAATGGSENNESVVSGDSASRARYAPMHYPPQVMAGESPRGAEYPPQYAWSEQPKQGAAYAYQQGYRRRGSGSNNSSGSGSANGSNANGGYHQSRDHRRGNAGYQRQHQQRWNNNSSGGYSSRHQHRHNQSPHSSTFSQEAAPPAGFGGVAPSEVSMGSSNAGFYNAQQQ
ncbi:hypothetical protein GGI10_005727 [Coemansia sp. RSA 2530]|nr:hypothetical protein GGI10_005727 [Coemansia sp. RSA 2530]